MSDQQLEHQEDQLRDEIGSLAPHLRKQYYQLERKAIRDPDTYAVLNYFFICGLHHFYLNKPLLGIFNLLAMLIGILLWQFYGYILVLLVIIIELPQLFRSQTIVRQYNLKVMRKTLQQVQST